MTTITIPKTTKKDKELIAIPKNAYDAFLAWQKMVKSIPTFKPTVAEKRALLRGRKNFAKGEYVRFEDLKHELGINR